MATTTSLSKVNAGPQVFLNFRGDEVRGPLVSHLRKELKQVGINVFIDTDEKPGEDLKNLFKRIEESDIAVAILSSRYTESQWCLDELVTIMKCSRKGEGCKNLWVIPVFYRLEGKFGANLWTLWMKTGRDSRIADWNEALQATWEKTALIFKESGAETVARIVKSVQDALYRISLQSQEIPKSKKLREEEKEEDEIPKPHKFQNRASTEAGEQRLKQLEEKLGVECNDNETRVLAIVGMVGIGKTYLAEKLYGKLQAKIGRYVRIDFDSEKSEEQGLEWVQKSIVKGLLNQDLSFDDGNTFEAFKDLLIEKKVAIFFDNVTDRKQIEPFLGNCDWIKNGSKIVITTMNKSLTEGFELNLYEVPRLNERDGFELFRAQFTNLKGNFMEMSTKFVDFAGGNPLALKEFAKELKGKDEHPWEARPGTLSQVSNEEVRKVLRKSFDNHLNEKQKDAFLDIICFFRSQEERYVTSLLDSSSTVAGREDIRDLVDKFLIHISDGRVEMHELLFTMGKELVETAPGKHWILSSNTAEALRNKKGRDQVRGIVIDMSKMEEMALDNKAFDGMSNLQYLKVFNSLCPMHGEAQCNSKLNLPDELVFPKDNVVRYFDWMNFPGKELPSHLEPKNLIDLRLPYSKITSVWSGAKDTPNLKWVDLSHSTMLTSLLGVSQAPNLLRLNLEGCTSLEKLPEEMKEMKSLVFLNLRGCTSLLSLPKNTIESLKTLILSGCSNLQTFDVLSENLEILYLNSTAIDGLPPGISNLHRLIFLNLKDCKNLATLPDCLGKLKSLQELKLSRCSKLKIFPDVKEMKENLRVLLLDGTSIAEMPGNIFDLSLLRRLCLSRNDSIRSLQFDMGKMFNLKWLELRNCKNLTSLPRLPPNLQSLNAQTAKRADSFVLHFH